VAPYYSKEGRAYHSKKGATHQQEMSQPTLERNPRRPHQKKQQDRKLQGGCTHKNKLNKIAAEKSDHEKRVRKMNEQMSEGEVPFIA
jgi:hypothetical protein